MDGELGLELEKVVVGGLLWQVFDSHCEIYNMHKILINFMLLVVDGAPHPANVDEPNDAD